MKPRFVLFAAFALSMAFLSHPVATPAQPVVNSQTSLTTGAITIADGDAVQLDVLTAGGYYSTKFNSQVANRHLWIAITTIPSLATDAQDFVNVMFFPTSQATPATAAAGTSPETTGLIVPQGAFNFVVPVLGRYMVIKSTSTTSVKVQVRRVL